MKLQVFNGGLVNSKQPQFLALNEAVVYQNIDNVKGSLYPAKGPATTGVAGNNYNWWSTALNKWFSSTTFTSYAEIGNEVFGANGSTSFRADSLGTYQIGITPPSDTDFSVSTGNATPVSDANFIRVSSGSPTALPLKTTYYIMATVADGFYSQWRYVIVPGDFSKPVTSELYEGEYTPIPADDTGSSTKRMVVNLNTTMTTPVHVFRYYNGAFRFLTELTASTSPFLDHTHALSGYSPVGDDMGQVFGTVQYTYTFYNPATGRESGPAIPSPPRDTLGYGAMILENMQVSSDPTVSHKRIYRVGNNLTRFSLVATIPNATTTYLDTVGDGQIPGTLLPTETWLPAPAGLNNLVTSNAMLFGSVGSKVVYSMIGEPESWPAFNFITFETTVTALAVVHYGIIVTTASKTFLITGTGPESLAVFPLSADQGCVHMNSMQTFKGAAIWVSKTGICMSSGNDVQIISKEKLGTLAITPVSSAFAGEVYYVATSGIIYAYDFGFGGIFKTYTVSAMSQYLTKKDDWLYMFKASLIRQAFVGNSMSMNYVSPIFSEGAFTENKIYKKIYIYAKGDIIIDIYINGENVLTKTLTGEKSHVALVPAGNMRGAYIQFEINGTGEVLEIEYEAGRNAPDGQQ
jgi:hypothetical protein